jgi:hypothetical protein
MRKAHDNFYLDYRGLDPRECVEGETPVNDTLSGFVVLRAGSGKWKEESIGERYDTCTAKAIRCAMQQAKVGAKVTLHFPHRAGAKPVKYFKLALANPGYASWDCHRKIWTDIRVLVASKRLRLFGKEYRSADEALQAWRSVS